VSARLSGARVTRTEDKRLLTGGGRFLDDLDHDALAVAFVRSPHAHARVVDIDVTEAVDTPGLVAVYTHDDLSGRAADPLPIALPHPALTSPRAPFALARDEVNHVGEAVVMVVARDRYAAEDAAERISVAYETLAPVVGLDAALAADNLVHHDVPGNVAGIIQQQRGDVESALAAAPNVLELDLSIERSMASPLEGRGVYAQVDPVNDHLLIYSSTQVPHAVRAAVAHVLGRPQDTVQVVAPDIGGAFGVKGVRPWPEEVLIPWAALRLGRPVKWVEDRREHFVASAQERAQAQHVRVGFDDDGRVLAYDIEVLHDVGAYTQYGLVVSQNTSSHLLGPYRVDAKRATVKALYTNAVMVAPYRGAGRPEAAFAMERMMDAVAEQTGLDPLTVRERNLVRPEQMPYPQGFVGQDRREVVYDSGDFPATLDKLKALVGWDDFVAFKERARGEGRRVGIGAACYVENTGLGPYEGGHVHVETNGRVLVAVGLSAQGQGHQTAFAQVAADELGVPMQDVHVTTGDTRGLRHSGGTFASRGLVMGGNAVALAARRVRTQALQVASSALEVDPSDLEIVEGHIRVKGDPQSAIPLGAVAAMANPLRYAFDEGVQTASRFAGAVTPLVDGAEPGLAATEYFSAAQSTFANGAHAVVVETDPQTAEIRVLRYCVVHDCGRVVNPLIVEGQVHGGVAQGIGGALYERLVYDEHGQLLNASFMDFLMPYVSEVPTVEIDHLESPSPLNPLGVKGAGEAGVIPGSAALASAIEDAEGFPIRQMPIGPSDLFALRQRYASGQWPALRRRDRQ
jgi:aerobic carbon-monoxide dehydrogenase large subunit